jgi:hypothetical protein
MQVLSQEDMQRLRKKLEEGKQDCEDSNMQGLLDKH